MRPLSSRLLLSHSLVALAPLLVVALAWLAAPGAVAERLGSVLSGAALLAAALSVWAARRLAAPVRQLARGATLLAANPRRNAYLGHIDGADADTNAVVEHLNAGLRQLYRELQDGASARAELETLLTQMADGLIVVDAGGVIVRVNPAALSLLGVQRPDVVGRTLLEAAPSYHLDALVRPILAGEAPAGAIEMRSPDEKRRALRALAAPLAVDDAPEGGGACVLLQDLTEVRRVDEMRRDFVANVSHELKTPLASIRALAETLVLRAARRPEVIPDLAARIVSECIRLGSLVEDLLSLSALESGRRELRLETLAVAEVLDELDLAFRARAEARHQRLTLTENGDLRLRADHDALIQALANLMDNALKYTPEGGTITVSADRQGEMVQLLVADDGPGFPREEATRIFERFYRVDPGRSREVGGTGLGLAIVRHLVEAQAGRVWAESDAGEGSRFFLQLPGE